MDLTSEPMCPNTTSYFLFDHTFQFTLYGSALQAHLSLISTILGCSSPLKGHSLPYAVFSRDSSYLCWQYTFPFKFQISLKTQVNPHFLRCFPALRDLPIFSCFPGSAVVKNLPANAADAGDSGSILGWGRSPGEGNGNPFQDSCLENPMDGGGWRATVPWVPKSWTRLSDLAWVPFFPRTSKFGRVFWALHQVIC